ncbi:MAG: hypothetical protein ACW987_19350 [Candidatus Thorarchaeota archaeon]|jgi:hypothetical protein
MKIKVGDELEGFCGGSFGKYYYNKTVEAIGPDWVVARDELEPEEPLFYSGDPSRLDEYIVE